MPHEKQAIVLVVEDEPLIRLAAISIVEEAGYQAVEAADADEAIALLERCSDIAVVFTDIEMPGSIDGERLAACIRDRWPPIKIIVTSGRRPAKSIVPSGGVFLPKPYRPQELVHHLDRMAA